MQRWGTPVKQWSPAHSRFAIELLTDCRKSLMSKARELDSHMEDEERDRARCERDPDAKPRMIHDVAHTRAVQAYVDKPALLAAALYAQWCADHIANDCVQLDRDLSEFVGQFADDEEHRSLIEHPANSLGFECSVVPSAFPPPFPMALAAPDSLLVGRHTRLDDVRDMLTEAAAAIAHTTTATTESVHGHISWLIGWCAPAATPTLEPEAFEDTAVGLLGEFRQRLLAIGCGLADSDADRDRLLAGAAYTQWIIDELHSGPGSRPCPGEPEALDFSHDGLDGAERIGHRAVDTYLPENRTGPIRTLMQWVMAPRMRDIDDRW